MNTDEYILTPTEQVVSFLNDLKTGIKPALAARANKFTTTEANLIRRLAGFKVNRYPRDIVNDVVSLRSQGLTYRGIAEQTGISTAYVNHLLQMHRKATAL